MKTIKCSICHQIKDRYNFSNNQINTRKNKCKECLGSANNIIIKDNVFNREIYQILNVKQKINRRNLYFRTPK